MHHYQSKNKPVNSSAGHLSAATPHSVSRQQLLTTAFFALVVCALLPTIGLAREVRITILSTTDLHGNILPTTDYDGNTDRGGVARCATKIAEVRKTSPNVLLVDNGDTFVGTAASFLSDGLVMVKIMNHLQYDAWVLGNHEFDWGLEKLGRCIEEMRATVLAANIIVPRGNSATTPAAFRKIAPFVIKEIEGVKLALIGLTTPGIPNWSRPRLIAPLQFEQSVDALKRTIPAARKAGAEIIVLLCHQGWREGPDDHANQVRTISRGFPEIDVIIGAHSHQNLPELLIPPRLRMIYCQAGYWGSHLARVDLAYDTARKMLIRKRSETMLMDSTVPLDAEILKLAQPQLAAAERELKTVIGKVEKEFSPAGAPHRETPMHNLICQAIAEALQKRGVQVDAVIHGLLSDRAMLREGAITVGDVWAIVPVENFVGVFEATPAELMQILEENAGHYSRASFRGIWGIRVAYETFGNRNQSARVIGITDKDGNPFPPDKRLKVAANSFDLSSGGTRFPKLRAIAESASAKLVEFDDLQTRQAVIDFIRARPSVTPQIHGWWSVRSQPKPAPPAKTPAPAMDQRKNFAPPPPTVDSSAVPAILGAH